MATYSSTPIQLVRDQTFGDQNVFATEETPSLDRTVSHVGQGAIASTSHSPLSRDQGSPPPLAAVSNISLQQTPTLTAHSGAQLSSSPSLAARVDGTARSTLTPGAGLDHPDGVDSVGALERPLRASPIQARFQQTLGLVTSGVARDVKIKEDTIQKEFNEVFGKLVGLIQADDPIDVFVERGEDGKPKIHTITVYRKEQDDPEKLEPHYYDTTHESEIIRLLQDNASRDGVECTREEAERRFQAIQEELETVGKEIYRIQKKVLPSTRSAGPMFSTSSIGDLHGPDPFINVGDRMQTFLQNPQFFKESFGKIMSESKYGMVEHGKLNDRGKRTLKEVFAANKLLDDEIKRHKDKIKERKAQLKNWTQPSGEPNTFETFQNLERKNRESEKQLAELEQVDRTSLALTILQLNREIILIKNDANHTAEKMSVREALRCIDDIETREQYQGFKLNDDKSPPIPFGENKLRNSLRTRMEGDMDKLVARQKTAWYKLRKPTTESEKAGAFSLGTVFFYRGATSKETNSPSLRIKNQKDHQIRSLPLSKQITGIDWALPVSEILVNEAGNYSRETAQCIQKHLSHLDEGSIEGICNILPTLQLDGKTPQQVIETYYGKKGWRTLFLRT